MSVEPASRADSALGMTALLLLLSDAVSFSQSPRSAVPGSE